MKKKAIFKTLAMALATTTVCSFAACGGGGSDIVKDANTLNVRIRSAGWGTTYIEALKKQFEETFAEEGYKINLLAPKADLVSTNVYRDIYSKSGVDVYFTEDVTAEDGVTGDFGQVFADLTDIYSKPAIKFDGTEETETIGEKLTSEHPNHVYDGKYYSMPYVYGCGGLVVNTRVLSEYGLELPRTTNELFACAEKIMEQAASTDVFPFTYSNSGNHYYKGLLTCWMAQYGGIEEYEQFWSFQKKNGDGTYTDMTTDCYEVFNTDSLKEAFTSFFRFYDVNMCALGSGQQDVNGAQAQIMKGTAVFYSVGSYFFNEEFTRFNQYVNDVTFINKPVISSLGIKLFGSGTSYNFSDAKCDEVLSTIIKYADQHKLAAEIEPLAEVDCGVSLELEDVETVCERRGYMGDGSGASVVVAENSPKKELAATFLRFCASREAGELMAKEMNSSSPWAVDAQKDSQYQYLKGVYNILSNPYAKQMFSKSTGYRKSMGVNNMFEGSTREIVSVDVYEKGITKYDSKYYTILAGKTNQVYADAAADMVNKIYTTSKKNVENGTWKVIVKD